MKTHTYKFLVKFLKNNEITFNQFIEFRKLFSIME